MEYLFDSSSIYVLINVNRPEILARNYTCSLARYEMGNILLTEMNARKTIKKEEQIFLLNLISRALNVMQILSIKNDEQDIIDIATRYNLSFYDASYVNEAKKLEIPLVTEDAKLTQKIKNHIKVISAKDLF